MKFELAMPACIRFGAGTVRDVVPLAATIGLRPLLVSGANPLRAEALQADLTAAGFQATTFHVAGEPTIAAVVQGAQAAIKQGRDMVIGMGGGSVMDAAKAIAALMTNRDDIMNYLEVIGRGLPLTQMPAPWIAVPTTAGSGAEVTRNAVLTAREHQAKVSLRHPGLLAKAAVIDPELTLSLPSHLTAATGLDALTQVIEPYVSSLANPFTDSICLEAMKRAARSLPKAYADGKDLSAREDMAVVSLFGGLALANAKLGAVHGFAAAVGGRFEIPHGVVCACLLAPVMEANIQAARERGLSVVLERYNTVARVLTGSGQATAQEGVRYIKALCADLNVQGLSRYGIQEKHFPEIVASAQKTSSIKGNPLELTGDELSQILYEAM